jgi:hypothetical protein
MLNLFPLLLLVLFLGVLGYAAWRVRRIATTDRHRSSAAEGALLSSVGIAPSWGSGIDPIALSTTTPSVSAPVAVPPPASATALPMVVLMTGKPAVPAAHSPAANDWNGFVKHVTPNAVGQAAGRLGEALRAAADAVEQAAATNGTPQERAARVAAAASTHVAGLPIAEVLQAAHHKPISPIA